ncbi:ABC-2 transporter permease [Paenibacillus typhae]|uniref:ABC-2 transporter permease n=1 Tax=Paenibacillus typhae TaxID=1174501 RepID=UPI001C8E8E7E|nr:ABC-2 transporter permease [Paenibacillus typhae]MBY0014704.1 ABC-2 transporter permease [Paenibacillus typhae]
MYNSFHLIRKDFIIVQKFILLLIPYYLVMGFTNFDNYTVFALLPAMLLLINSCTMDVQNNNQKFLVSLPIPRQQIVMAKYLAILPYSILSYACTVLLYLVAFSAGRTNDPLAWRELLLCIAGFPLLASFYLPLHYWLGRKGTQVVNMVFIMLIMLNFAAVKQLMEWFPGLAGWVSNGTTDSPLVPVIAGLGYVLILFCSYLISLRVFTAKDI